MNDNKTSISDSDPVELTSREQELLESLLTILKNLDVWDDEKLGSERRKLNPYKDELLQAIEKLGKKIEQQIEWYQEELEFLEWMGDEEHP